MNEYCICSSGGSLKSNPDDVIRGISKLKIFKRKPLLRKWRVRVWRLFGRREGLMKYTIQLHCGKYRIQHLWNLAHIKVRIFQPMLLQFLPFCFHLSLMSHPALRKCAVLDWNTSLKSALATKTLLGSVNELF